MEEGRERKEEAQRALNFVRSWVCNSSRKYGAAFCNLIRFITHIAISV